MQKIDLPMKIFVWVEAVVSLRILLFQVPVIMYCMKQGNSLSILEWKMITMAMCAVSFFTASLAAIAGFRLWRLFQYVAVIATCILNIMFNMRFQHGFGLIDLIPSFVAITVMVVIMFGGSRVSIQKV